MRGQQQQKLELKNFNCSFNIGGNKMKITQKIIDDLEKALDMRKKNGDPVWDDGDEIDVCVGGTFAADKFISLINRTKNPVVSAAPHPNYDYEKGKWKEGYER